MNTLKRLMVGLDLTEMDETLIRYTAFLCRISSIQKVYFIHTERSLDIHDDVFHDIDRQGLSAGEAIHTAISDKVQPHFNNLPQVQLEIKVLEGSPLKELLHISKSEQIDLAVVGRKLRLKGSGLLSQKIVRNGRVSVLFVPENFEPKLKRAVISVDFSEYSMMAMERLLNSALVNPDLELVCLHVYEVPTGYITLGISYEDFDRRMQGFAKEKFDQLLQRFPELKARTTLKLVKKHNDDDIGELIVLEAKRAKGDLLVVGAKGKTAAALFVVGSVTEKLMHYNDDMPLIVFKKKKEETGFLDALLGTD
ncbi:universal stress protein [Pontibacter sp. SGAir0037]|uniref:universal stress protein n=1 Tax=Pontibacter sp. SGAir0037 TaxID=2571030 RepID=UPI0010CCC84E|nr:universal stress protein [Pontibacter sp. SGAir0037]QCR21980.1 universal stress protein [Pontibacter sp. SGAir0037]